MRHEKEEEGTCVQFREAARGNFLCKFFFLSRVCTRMSGIMNYRVCLLDTFSFPASCFILLYIVVVVLFRERLVEFLIHCIIDASLLLSYLSFRFTIYFRNF